MEQPLITAVTHSTSEARVTLIGVPDAAGAAARIFEALASANVNVDMIDQNEPDLGGRLAEISFTFPREDLRVARAALEPLAGQSYSELLAAEQMGKVSIIGAGMRSHPGVAAKGLRGARRTGRQHRHDLDLADQDLLRDRPRQRREGRPGAARRLRARRQGHGPRGRSLQGEPGLLMGRFGRFRGPASPARRAGRPVTLDLALHTLKIPQGRAYMQTTRRHRRYVARHWLVLLKPVLRLARVVTPTC